MLLVTLMGPSSTVPRTGGQLSLNLQPSPWLIVGLDWTIAALGGIAPGLGLLAIWKGWRPDARTLLFAALPVVALLAILPVAGSTDLLSYAMYGRITALGHDPARWVPQKLILSHDPLVGPGGIYAPQYWRRTPSVYGPIANGLFATVALIAGASMAKIVIILKLVMASCFAFTAWALDRLAGPSAQRRARVLVLWTLNPAMLWACVVSGHIDAFGVALIIGALLVLRDPYGAIARLPRSRALLIAGALLGAAAAVKAPLVLAGLGLAWTVRRSLRDLIALGVGGALVLGTSYLIAGKGAVHVLIAKSDSYSPISPWRWPLHLISKNLWQTGPNSAIGLLAGAVLIALLAWKVPPAHPDLPEIRPLFVLLCGWLVTSPLQRPWYDAIILSLLALLPANRGLDGLLVLRSSIGMYGDLPGVPPLPHTHPRPLVWVAQTFVAWIVSGTVTVLLGIITLYLIVVRRVRVRGGI